MSVPLEPKREELIDLLNRCWMTHDGMWFYHCLQEFGIEKANHLNKKALGIEKKIENFQELKGFFERAAPLFIPPFMNATMSFPRENVLHWAFEPKNCFAFKGIKRIGVIDRYECGVIYRLACWFDSLGVKYCMTPPVERCLMLAGDACSGDFEFIFP
jgi:hypothetical protein